MPISARTLSLAVTTVPPRMARSNSGMKGSWQSCAFVRGFGALGK
jgi:hypothetical protein